MVVLLVNRQCLTERKNSGFCSLNSDKRQDKNDSVEKGKIVNNHEKGKSLLHFLQLPNVFTFFLGSPEIFFYFLRVHKRRHPAPSRS